jgi:hypothetical protein
MTNRLVHATDDLPRRTVTGRVDLYRDIHKGLRHALFALTVNAGCLDTPDDTRVLELTAESRRLIGMVRDHDEHEAQRALDELIEVQAPALAALIHDEHRVLVERLEWLASRADELAAAPAGARVTIAHTYYLELAAFTSAYLEHLDLEERVVMPALAARCDDAELARVLAAILEAAT